MSFANPNFSVGKFVEKKFVLQFKQKKGSNGKYRHLKDNFPLDYPAAVTIPIFSV